MKFTTIALLRASTAMESRVNTVENYLKRTYPGYTPEMPFPIFEIAISNAIEDVHWVVDNSSTHYKSLPSALTNLFKGIDESERSMFGSGAKNKAVADVTAKMIGLIVASPVPMEGFTQNVSWFTKHLAAFKALPATTPTVPVTPSAAQQTAAASVQGAEETISHPDRSTKALPTKDVSAANTERIAKLVALGTSKDKRSQIIEGMGLSFEQVLLALASTGVATPSNFENAVKVGVK